MRTANEVIEAYVRDVAKYLPRAKKNDVAFELRALLTDELAAKAAQAGRAPDQEMVMEILRGFGRPAEAAARYHPRQPLIDAADNHNFLFWAIFATLVFETALPENHDAALQGVGFVFLCFVIATWFRRRRPSDQLAWRPRWDPTPAVASRLSVVVPGLALLVFPFAMYLAPQRWWETVTFGKAISSGLVLTDAFLASWQRAATLAALGLMIAVYVAVAVTGGWRSWSRQLSLWANLVVGLLLASHAAPLRTLVEREPFEIFTSAVANQTARPIFGTVGSFMVLVALYEAYREWTRVDPAPDLGAHTP